MKLYGYCMECNGAKMMSFNSEQFLKGKGSSAMMLPWQGACGGTQCSEYSAVLLCCAHAGHGMSLLIEMKTYKTALPHRFGSQLTSCECILVHTIASILPFSLVAAGENSDMKPHCLKWP